uniref:RRM domain-containing protein n=1 Tax=Oryza barthii TaxID=65489 RepID=A0A0D3F3E2_9ORYZ
MFIRHWKEVFLACTPMEMIYALCFVGLLLTSVSDLPPELVCLIGSRLHTAINVVRFHAVCSDWRQSLRHIPPSPPPAAALLPWHLAPSSGDDADAAAGVACRCVFSKTSYHAPGLCFRDRRVAHADGTASWFINDKLRDDVLGDHVLFLGYPGSFAVEAAQFHGDVSGGSVYFVVRSESCRVYTYSFVDAAAGGGTAAATLVETLPAGWNDERCMWFLPLPCIVDPVLTEEQEEDAAARANLQRLHRHQQRDLRIHVGDLSPKVDSLQLREMYSEHGKVVRARVAYDKRGRSRGFGFLTMATQEGFDRALGRCNAVEKPDHPLSAEGEHLRWSSMARFGYAPAIENSPNKCGRSSVYHSVPSHHRFPNRHYEDGIDEEDSKGGEDSDGAIVQEDLLGELLPKPDLSWERPLKQHSLQEPPLTPHPPASDAVAHAAADTAGSISARRHYRLSRSKGEGAEEGRMRGEA